MAELAPYLHCQLKMNSSADYFYDIFRSRPERFQGLMPDVIRTVEPISPDVPDKWRWTFVDDTANEYGTWKNSVARNNQELRSVTWTLLEAPVLGTRYNALRVDYLFSPTGNGCEVEVKLYYKMKGDNVQPPNSYMGFICGLLVAADNNPPRH